MTREASHSYLLYKYSINKNDTVIRGYEHLKIFESLKAVEVSHRIKEASESDKDTSLVNLNKISSKHTEKDGSEVTSEVVSFKVARHITERTKNDYDKATDTLDVVTEYADEYWYGELIVFPEEGLIAALDKTGPDLLNAKATMSRLRSIITSKKGYQFRSKPAGSILDIEKALKNWSIHKVTFSARPFNPTVHKPGDMLHKLFSTDNVQVNGSAKPHKGEKVEFGKDGFLNEILGLSHKGYAEVGLSGKTEDGYDVSIAKKKPNQPSAPQQIKIKIPMQEGAEEQVLAIVKAMQEFNGKQE